MTGPSMYEKTRQKLNSTKESFAFGANFILDKITSEETQKVAFSSVLFTTGIFVLFVTAFIIYVVIYLITIPNVTTRIPVYLDYQQ